MILPFAVLLGGMALGATLVPGWWHRHYPKVALGLGAVTLAYYLFILRDVPRVLHSGHDYLSFIALVGSLFVVAGGIHIQVSGRASALGNVIFLLSGAVMANVLGTTGAAMLLIRPWIRLNRSRLAAHHAVFFIFIVANVGGCLTPIGDPPLFLGYLQSIPFWWITRHAWPAWLLAVGSLLAIFYVLEKIQDRQERRPAGADASGGGWKFGGLRNLLFLGVILLAVFVNHPPFLREGLMVAAALGSYFTTPKSVHASNNFDLEPIREVIVLFAGIFATMMPALDWLDQRAGLILGTNPSPEVFFWGAGGLSAVLDNAPTYLSFLSALSGVTGAPDISGLLARAGSEVLAISAGAVFFGAMTYIGNAPNFMVKTIAAREGAPAPEFLQFVGKYSLPFLLPVLGAVWLIFFRG